MNNLTEQDLVDFMLKLKGKALKSGEKPVFRVGDGFVKSIYQEHGYDKMVELLENITVIGSIDNWNDLKEIMKKHENIH
jgi:hypothetical protein